MVAVTIRRGGRWKRLKLRRPERLSPEGTARLCRAFPGRQGRTRPTVVKSADPESVIGCGKQRQCRDEWQWPQQNDQWKSCVPDADRMQEVNHRLANFQERVGERA